MIALFGPRTRLGAAVLARLTVDEGARGREVLLVARSPEERDALARIHPDRSVVDGSDGRWPRPEGEVAAIVAAFGLAHPGPLRLGDLERDARAFDDFASSCSGAARLHAVLVSSVLALAPTRGRAAYGGSKNAAEALVAEAVRRHPAARCASSTRAARRSTRSREPARHALHTLARDRRRDALRPARQGAPRRTRRA
ncbi:MAG: hypothetical protein R3F34_04425 [Planctomycetota bacterium]